MRIRRTRRPRAQPSLAHNKTRKRDHAPRRAVILLIQQSASSRLLSRWLNVEYCNRERTMRSNPQKHDSNSTRELSVSFDRVMACLFYRPKRRSECNGRDSNGMQQKPYSDMSDHDAVPFLVPSPPSKHTCHVSHMTTPGLAATRPPRVPTPATKKKRNSYYNQASRPEK